MHDVRVDYGAMEASRTAYKNMRGTLESATGALARVSGSAVAQDTLRERLQDLHDSWGGGLSKLARYADDAGKGLEGILEAFQGLDTEIAAGMEQQESAS